MLFKITGFTEKKKIPPNDICTTLWQAEEVFSVLTRKVLVWVFLQEAGIRLKIPEHTLTATSSDHKIKLPIAIFRNI